MLAIILLAAALVCFGITAWFSRSLLALGLALVTLLWLLQAIGVH